jgi:hypothetical protein
MRSNSRSIASSPGGSGNDFVVVAFVTSASSQVVLSSTSPTSDADAAAPDTGVPSPFALSGASPSLHARHKEQRFLFLIESFEWLHWWHGHDKARRVSDRSIGILLREAL